MHIIFGVTALFHAAFTGPACTGQLGLQEGFEEVRCYSFEADEDGDGDLQPDDWSRRRGADFPEYVKMEIDPRVASHGGRSLRVDLNAGHAACYARPLSIDGLHEFVVEARLRGTGLKRDAAVVTASLLDASRTRVERLVSEPITGDQPEWKRVRIGPFRPAANVRFIVLGCHVVRGGEPVVGGRAWFDALRIGRRPVLEVHVPWPPYLLVGAQATVEARVPTSCAESGNQIRLALRDQTNEVLLQRASDMSQAKEAMIEGHAVRAFSWTLPTLQAGHYRASVSLDRQGAQMLRRDTTLAVVEPVARAGPPDFGWSLAKGWGNLRLDQVADLASFGGIHWFKLPMARGEAAATPGGTQQDLARFLDALEKFDVEIVGLLAAPAAGPATGPADDPARRAAVEGHFDQPNEHWQQMLEEAAARHGFRTDRWQLGDDGDAAFPENDQRAKEILATAGKVLGRSGREMKIGVPWNGTTPRQPFAEGHRFFAVPLQTLPDAAAEKRAPEPDDAGLERWVLVEPPPRSAGDDAARGLAFARDMLAARLRGATRIFTASPFDAERGLAAPDGSPTAMYPPWRTMANALRGKQRLGSLVLPQGTANAVLAGPEGTVIVLWNDGPIHEQLDLGGCLTAIDAWGRAVPLSPDASGSTQQLDAATGLAVVRGCPEALVRWCLALDFEKGKILSRQGKQVDAIVGSNPFGVPVNGRLTVAFPAGWQVEPEEWTLQVAAGQPFRLPFTIVMPHEAEPAQLQATLSVDLTAHERFRCRMPRTFRLESGDVELDVDARLRDDGRLEVEQILRNNTEPGEVLDFQCTLYIPGRIRQRVLALGVGQGEDRRNYVIRDARSLRGTQLWLRVEEVDGARVLNRRWVVP
jgi:hypothetical protein